MNEYSIVTPGSSAGLPTQAEIEAAVAHGRALHAKAIRSAVARVIGLGRDRRFGAAHTGEAVTRPCVA